MTVKVTFGAIPMKLQIFEKNCLPGNFIMYDYLNFYLFLLLTSIYHALYYISLNIVKISCISIYRTVIQEI